MSAANSAGLGDGWLLRNRATTALITGGTQGLGLAVAKRLGQEKARGIVISGRNVERGEDAAVQVRATGTDCLFVPADVSRADDCHRLIETSLRYFGTVNSLVNSAALTDRGTLLDTTLELWDRHFNTNARAPFLTMQGLVKHLVDTGQPGSIVNIISMASHCGQSYLTPYSASKGALATLTKNVANTYARQRIRCNGILIGWMDTPGETADPTAVPPGRRRLVGEGRSRSTDGAIGQAGSGRRTGRLPVKPGVRCYDWGPGGL